MRRELTNVRFPDLLSLCEEFFGKPRQSGTINHTIFKTPWFGDPRINIRIKGTQPFSAILRFFWSNKGDE